MIKRRGKNQPNRRDVLRATKLATPQVINLTVDPKEREPLIPAGAPLNHVPARRT